MPVALHDTARVPGFIRFTADDYRSCAMALRMCATQSQRDAEKQSNPVMAKLFNDAAQRQLQLAEKCELAARVL
jgi:hypothetical protein